MTQAQSKVIQFANRFGLCFPGIIQAPMAGGITTPELVASVSNAGGLGSFATGYLTPKAVSDGIQAIKSQTKRPFAVNVFISSEGTPNSEKLEKYQRHLSTFKEKLGFATSEPSSVEIPPDSLSEIVDIIIQEEITIVSFTFGCLNEEYVRKLKEKNVFLIGTASTLKDALLLESSGVDAVVAQGYEAGGHRGGFSDESETSSISALVLIPQLVDKLSIPVIAAGGIQDGRGIISALALGACAVQMGTAFLTTTESGANPHYQQELLKIREATEDVTTLTRVYSGKPARAIKTEFVNEMEKFFQDNPGYPFTHYLTSDIRRVAKEKRDSNMMSLWAGQGALFAKRSPHISASDLISQLREETKNELDSLHNTFNYKPT